MFIVIIFKPYLDTLELNFYFGFIYSVNFIIYLLGRK